MHKVLPIAAMMMACVPAAYTMAPAPKVIFTKQVKVGEQTFVKLPGNPEACYKWRLNPGMSQGLGLVSVKMIGWLMAKKGRSIFKQEKNLMNVSVAGKAAGEARLAFDYYRIQEGRYVTRTSLVKFIVKP